MRRAFETIRPHHLGFNRYQRVRHDRRCDYDVSELQATCKNRQFPDDFFGRMTSVLQSLRDGGIRNIRGQNEKYDMAKLIRSVNEMLMAQ